MRIFALFIILAASTTTGSLHGEEPENPPASELFQSRLNQLFDFPISKALRLHELRDHTESEGTFPSLYPNANPRPPLLYQGITIPVFPSGPSNHEPEPDYSNAFDGFQIAAR